jgi:hypothetical protein
VLAVPSSSAAAHEPEPAGDDADRDHRNRQQDEDVAAVYREAAVNGCEAVADTPPEALQGAPEPARGRLRCSLALGDLRLILLA